MYSWALIISVGKLKLSRKCSVKPSRISALELYPDLEITVEEEIEKLEQLRWLKSGWQIGCSSVYFNGVEINSPEDVDVWHTKNFQ